jgi:kettin, putative
LFLAWYDQQVKKYQKDRKNTELDKVFEEKLTPGGTEVEVWRTQAVAEGERVKIREHVKDDAVSKPDVKRYSTETTFLDSKTGKPKEDNQSQVSWMAKSYQTKLEEKEPHPGSSPESSIYGKEIQTKVQRQEQVEEKDNLKIKRKIKTTETFQQEHKDSTKERKVVGPQADSKPPSFSKKLQPVRAFEGEKAIFVCYFQGTPTPTITWFRENFEMQSSKDFEVSPFLLIINKLIINLITQIITTENKSTLAIKEVYLEDSGMFSVKAENRVGSAKSSANLIVEGKVKFILVK